MNERTKTESGEDAKRQRRRHHSSLARASSSRALSRVPAHGCAVPGARGQPCCSSRPPCRASGLAVGSRPLWHSLHRAPHLQPSQCDGARLSKVPGAALACCPHVPLPLVVCPAWRSLCSCRRAHGSRATLRCATAVQLPTQARQQGRGAERRAAALANALLSSGTEQTVAGYGANLLQGRIFNIPPLQELLEAAREPQAET